MTDQKEAPISGTGFLVRLYWMGIGNVLLLFLFFFIVEKRLIFPSLLDAAYLVALASLILIRYVDIRFLNGETGDGKPATLTHWRRYAMIIGSAGGAAWLLARVLAHFL